jgi:hypothetical protein
MSSIEDEIKYKKMEIAELEDRISAIPADQWKQYALKVYNDKIEFIYTNEAKCPRCKRLYTIKRLTLQDADRIDVFCPCGQMYTVEYKEKVEEL